MSKLIRRRIDIDPLEFSSANQNRTPGIHLTDVLRDILMMSGVMKKQKSEEAGGFTQEQLRKYQLQGYLWEDVVSLQLASRLLGRRGEYSRLPEIAFNFRTGVAFWVEYDRDGNCVTPIPPGFVICSPDGMRLMSDRVRLAEFKWTTKSANMNPEIDKPEWFYQVKSYLLPLSIVLQCDVREVEWHVQFAVGSRWGEPPVYEEWERSYTTGEIRNCWEMLDSHLVDQITRDPEHRWKDYLVAA